MDTERKNLFLRCLISLAFFVATLMATPAEASDKKAAAKPEAAKEGKAEKPESFRSATYEDWTVQWSAGRVQVKHHGKTTDIATSRIEHLEDGGFEQYDYAVLSVVGPWVAISEGWYWEGGNLSYRMSWKTRDMSGGANPVSLDAVFGERAVFKALKRDPLVRRYLRRGIRYLGAGKPRTLAELLESVHGDCDVQIGPGMLTDWAFHHVKGDQVAVRIGLSHGEEVCRGKLTQLGVYLPIPKRLKPMLAAAEKRGTLMKDLQLN